jgi:hypothetical protein
MGRISRSMSRWVTEYGIWQTTNGVFPFAFAYSFALTMNHAGLPEIP